MAILSVHQRVRVKLTPDGLWILHRNHEELVKRNFPSGHIYVEYKPPTPDADGYYTFQLARLFEEFGQHMTMGAFLPFHHEIIIPDTP